MYHKIHKQKKVLFIIPLAYLRNSLFWSFQTQLFIIHFLFIPVIPYSLFSFHTR